MKLSVCLVAYNHERFIRQAIEGVLSQKCNFSFELIIANDCSSDKTDAIVRDVISVQREGITITYFCHEKNYGMMSNFVFTLNACSGEFIALCEGDDYWTDPYKLQKQVDFLENNPHLSLCGHTIHELNDSLGTMKAIENKANKQIGFETFARIGCAGVYTLSMVFHNSEDFKKTISNSWVKNLDGIDHLILLYATHRGNNAHVLPDNMGVYRIHNNGIWSGAKLETKCINALKNYYLYSGNLNLTPSQIYLLSDNRKQAYQNWVLIKWKKIPRMIRPIFNRSTVLLFAIYPNGKFGFLLGNWIDRFFFKKAL